MSPTRTGGGRTSESAPLDVPLKTRAPMGRQQTFIRNPHMRANENTLRKGRVPGWRGGGPPCPLRWTSLCKPPPQWAVQSAWIETHAHSTAKHHEKSTGRHPRKPFPEGEIVHRPGSCCARTLGDPGMSLQDMAWMDAVCAKRANCHRVALGRSKVFGCPLDRLPPDECPAKRTQRSARLWNRLVSLFVKEAWINSTTNRRVDGVVQSEDRSIRRVACRGLTDLEVCHHKRKTEVRPPATLCLAPADGVGRI